MPTAADDDLPRLAFWAKMMTEIKGSGMSIPAFSYREAEWARLEVLAGSVGEAAAGAFVVINAVVFIALAAAVIAGVFFPLALLLFPNRADTKPLPFALLLAASCLLTLGFGLPLAMRVTAWLLTTDALRARLSPAAEDAALWTKVRYQMTRMTVIMCGLLVPGILVFITFNIEGGPLITTLKWVASAAVILSMLHTWHRQRTANRAGR
jgi:hypothetical protein